jgi:hypothetical protein
MGAPTSKGLGREVSTTRDSGWFRRTNHLSRDSRGDRSTWAGPPRAAATVFPL